MNSLNLYHNNNMAALARTNSTFVAPAPRAIGAPNMSLEHDHRQKHPGSLYSDENHTHFNTPNGVVEVPRPLLLGSDDWKIAQFAQKKTEAESEGHPLTASQIKAHPSRPFKRSQRHTMTSDSPKRNLQKRQPKPKSSVSKSARIKRRRGGARPSKTKPKRNRPLSTRKQSSLWNSVRSSASSFLSHPRRQMSMPSKCAKMLSSSI